ncbi:polysaccharide biosynthesis/export family protein [uncultured Paludibaculum sp.]|uniref:polysaccharide biosynthesis/export family protein n=1 Tax=uncultured Paludibaculum sp. TaxID=1765020 RepID=UPI002AABF350|nr:polysaccharide biosynthesis/export family protein [uncultured Paludibaculum sp.]
MKLAMVLVCAALAWGQQAEGPLVSTYVLGPGDQLIVRVLDMEEMSKDPFQIDMRGNINLPMTGRIYAKGMTVEQLEEAIAERLKAYIKQPDVSVMLQEMRSQPVSVLGSVRTPGVHQLQGEKNLLEVLSLAGGLQPDAGYSVRIAREKQWGKIPLPGAKLDDTGQYWIAEVGVKELMEARAPEKNIPIKPHDVVTAPKGQIVYVMGAVKKSGGFVLGEKERTTVLEALSMAEGFDNFAKRGGAKILRKTDKPEQRLEIALDLGKILDGKQKDVPMEQDDILFVPTSGVRKTLARAGEAAFGIGTGVAVYRR